jgi:hypothetical protein
MSTEVTMPGPHTFSSKAQWRFAFAKYGNTGWVKRWAETNQAVKPFHALPARKSIRKR